jgi:hypothetical protein
MALDPFWHTPRNSGGRTGQRDAYTDLLAGYEPIAYLQSIQNNPARFQFQGESIQWAPCGTAITAEQSIETGSSQANAYTHTHTAKVTHASTVAYEGTTIFSTSASLSVTWGYTRNRMTEQSSTTEAQATLGGGGQPCAPDAPLYQSERWYDATFGTLLFPTRDVTANVEGTVTGSGAAGQRILVEGTGGRRVRTSTDASGRYRLYLEPGSYRIAVHGPRQDRLSQQLTVTILSEAQALQRLAPLSLGEDRAVLTPSPTPNARDLDLPGRTPPSRDR